MDQSYFRHFSAANSSPVAAQKQGSTPGNKKSRVLMPKPLGGGAPIPQPGITSRKGCRLLFVNIFS